MPIVKFKPDIEKMTDLLRFLNTNSNLNDLNDLNGSRATIVFSPHFAIDVNWRSLETLKGMLWNWIVEHSEPICDTKRLLNT